MRSLYTHGYALGLHWILAFVVVGMFTVSTCVKQQTMLLHASSSHTVVAMKQTGRIVQ